MNYADEKKNSHSFNGQSSGGLTIAMFQPKNLKIKLPWYYGPPFLLFWLTLYIAVVLPLYNRLPDAINSADEMERPGEFVAEHAQALLYTYDRIGPKVVGSNANEILTVDFLLSAIENVRSVMRNDLYEMEVNVQQASGAYIHWTMVNMYQSVQNVVVKLSTRSSSSESYLLVNSHFDSKPSSPGSGDDGTMVVVMLEVLRQMAKSETVFEHPIVFLFNGAEENPLQASHGFITQHKWANNCQALINLEVAGSGGRDLLFQSGPNHPWLMQYYNKYAKHPFATTMAEEIFQSGILPSDTDFRIFRDYGNVPGLDMAQISNGFVYHTVFDNFEAIPRKSLQNSGENVLPLLRGISNATEMYNTTAYSEGHSIFFDFLGLFFVYYSETTGVILNCCIAVLALVLISISLWRMSKVSDAPPKNIVSWFGIIFALHVLGALLSIGLPLLMAVLYDAGNRSLTYFSNTWLMFGLYVCPSVIGLSLPTTLYYSFRENNNISHAYHLQMSLHAHGVLLALIAIILNAMGLRTPYLCMISSIFYAASLITNLLSRLHDRGYYWTLVVQFFQLIPFLYLSYLFYVFISVFVPMMGRNGSAINPDLYIALLCALGTFFALGFVSPLINMFHWSKAILATLATLTFIFCMIAVSDVGFPYRPKTNIMRVNFMHVRRIFYEYNGSVSLEDSGYYFDFQDRRLFYPLEETSVNLTGIVSIEADCDKYMMCGVPCFNHRWCKARRTGRWLPRDEPVAIPALSTLKLTNRSLRNSTDIIRYEFELTGPPHMSLFIQPMEDVSVQDWSFIRNMLDNPEKYSAPYHIFFSYGKDNSTLSFYIDLSSKSGNLDEPLFELGVSAHFVNYDYERDSAGKKFIADFPSFVHVMEWPTLYERYIF